MPLKKTHFEKAAFRDRLCKVALEIFVEEGLEALTMRKLAKELGVSAMTPYNYFEDRHEILQEILDRAYGKFAASQREVIDQWAEPLENLIKLGEAYLRFAIDHPLQYSVLFLIQKQRPFQSMERRGEAFLPLFDTVTQLVEAGVLEGDPGLIAHLLWSGKHGLISLKIAGRLMTEVSPPMEEMLSEMSERILRSFLKIEQN